MPKFWLYIPAKDEQMALFKMMSPDQMFKGNIELNFASPVELEQGFHYPDDGGREKTG